jgi:hypothetical protein
MTMELKRIVRDACPDFALKAYRRVRDKVASAKLAAPVVQMYINDGDIETIAGFNNFLSFLTAGVQTSGKLRVTLRDSDGGLVLDQTTRLNHFENRFVDIKAMLATQGKSSGLGLISLIFVPDHMRSEAYKKLGVLASHFFMFYRGGKGGVAMVHPSSTLDPASPPSGPFITNQVVYTTGLEGVSLYQCNPSQVAHELTIGLQDADTKDVICSRTLSLPPMGVRKVSFVAGTDFSLDSPALRVFTSSLPTANSKPMLCRCYSGGRFSMSHS